MTAPTYKIGNATIDVTIRCLDADGNLMADLPVTSETWPIQLPVGCCQARQRVTVAGRFKGTVVIGAARISTPTGQWVEVPGLALTRFGDDVEVRELREGSEA